ncbi:hypothetical protein BDV29DRAFT_156774 [Aspergillus leporis]|uniref:Major facilitator superfamily domain-containing protein n=1 Tax=Aspergillus leporis TaxID=41062 RepID=A0A5N5X476_9EURO|nr:hypothetical protein BDV29DRAFT_156774 [Aspergillus leporis]
MKTTESHIQTGEIECQKAILGELAGHLLHDILPAFATRRNNGRLEARLLAIWLATPFMIAGLILLSFTLEGVYHCMLTSLGWGCYREASGEVAVWINFARTAGGFVISYLMVEWANKQGAGRLLGTMAGIAVFAFLVILVLQAGGKRMRLWDGLANFKTVRWGFIGWNIEA